MRVSQSLPNINRDPPPHLRAHAGVRPPKGGWGVQGPGPRLLLLQNPSPTRQSNRSIAANKSNGNNTNNGNGHAKLQSSLTNGQRTLQPQQHHATRVGPINGDFSPMAKTKKLAGNAEAAPNYNQTGMATAGVSTAFSGAPSTYQAPFQPLTTTYAHMSARDGVPPPQAKNRLGPTGDEVGAGDTAPPATPGGHRPARTRRRKHVHEPGREGVQFRPYQFGVPEKYKLAYQAMPDPPDPFNNPPPKPTNNPYVQKQRRDNEFKLVASRWVRPPRPQDLEHPDQFYFNGTGSNKLASLSAPATLNLDQAGVPVPTSGANRSFGSSAPLPVEYIQPPPPPPPVHPPVSNLKMVFTPGLAPKPLEAGERQHLQAADMFGKSSPFAGAHTASGGRMPLTLTHSASSAHVAPAAAANGHGGNKGASPPRATGTMGASASAPVLVAKPKASSNNNSTKKKEPVTAATAASSSSGTATPPKVAEKKVDEPSQAAAPGGPAAAAVPPPSQQSQDLPPPSQKQDLPAPTQQAPPPQQAQPEPVAAAPTPAPVAARPPSAVQSQPAPQQQQHAAEPAPAPASVAAPPKEMPKERPPSAVQSQPAPTPTVRAASIVAAPTPAPASAQEAAPPSASPKGDYAADKFDD